MEQTYTARMTPQQVSYRKASDPQRCCRVCYMNDGGNCSLIGPVEPGDVCDRFIPNPVEGAALSRVLALSSKEPKEVKGYERLEHGHLEHVAPHTQGYAKGATHVKTQGMMVDALGHEHWGWYGGAGLLLHHTDSSGVTRYMLQKRSFGVQHGGSYSTPGGAIDKPGGVLETPEAAAFREAEEEWGKLPVPVTVTGVHTEHHGTPGEPGHWSYTTVHGAVPEMFKPTGHASHGSENAGHKWVTPEEMAKLDLHPDFVSTAVHLGMEPPPPKQAKYKVGDHVYHSKEHAGAVITNIREPELYHAPRYDLKYDYGKPETGVAEERHLSTYSTYKSSKPSGGKKPDDYEKGSEVTWMFKGDVQHGVVQGGVPSEKTAKGYYPDEYVVRKEDGTEFNVPWGALAPKGFYDKKDSGWDKTYKTEWPSTSYGLGTAHHEEDPVPKLAVMSPTTPGMQYKVPAWITGVNNLGGVWQVERIWEAPGGGLVLGVKGKRGGLTRRYSTVYVPGKHHNGLLYKELTPAVIKKQGLVEVKMPGGSSALDKVVAAATPKTMDEKSKFKPGDTILFTPNYGGGKEQQAKVEKLLDFSEKEGQRYLVRTPEGATFYPLEDRLKLAPKSDKVKVAAPKIKGVKFQVGDRVIHDMGYPNKKSGTVVSANPGGKGNEASYIVQHDDGTHSGIIREQTLSKE